MTLALDPADLQRYARQLTLAQVGLPGQVRLATSRVLVVGAGGLGSPALLYLAAAGVGTLGIVDDDLVDVSNLHRQVVHTTDAVGQPKTESAARSIARFNPRTALVEHRERLTSANALDLLRGYDVVVDGSDNFATRYAVSDACVELGIPHVWGSVLRFEGQASVWWAGHGPCYRCVFPDEPDPGAVPSCEDAGVLGFVCAAVGSVQATETVKLLLGIGESLVGRLLVHDALRQTWDTLAVSADPACPTCGPRAAADPPTLAGSRHGMPAARVPEPQPVAQVQPGDLTTFLSGFSSAAGALLVDVRDEAERAVVAIPGGLAIPLDEFRVGSAYSRPELADRSRPVVLYCASGARSEQAARLAQGAGFSEVASLAGGLRAWLRHPDSGVVR